MSRVSPRRADPALRESLIEAAAALLAKEGPLALSTRRLASEVGSSTMAVYTHFGGMDDLVRAVAHEGFARLNVRMRAVGESPDPVADVAELGLAYRRNALENPALYAVMFGGAVLGGYLIEPYDAQTCFTAQVCGLIVGAGDDVESAMRSMDRDGARSR